MSFDASDIVVGAMGSLLSVLMTNVVPWTYKSYINFKRIFLEAQDDVFVGEWHVYHFTILNGTLELLTSKARVKRGFSVPYKIELQELIEGGPRYKGFCVVENNNLIIHLTRLNGDHKEVVFIRCEKPVSRMGVVPGLWLGHGHRYEICSGINIFSQEKLQRESLDQEILNYFGEDSPRIIRL
jgi:hypothetical protein